MPEGRAGPDRPGSCGSDTEPGSSGARACPWRAAARRARVADRASGARLRLPSDQPRCKGLDPGLEVGQGAFVGDALQPAVQGSGRRIVEDDLEERGDALLRLEPLPLPRRRAGALREALGAELRRHVDEEGVARALDPGGEVAIAGPPPVDPEQHVVVDDVGEQEAIGDDGPHGAVRADDALRRGALVGQVGGGQRVEVGRQLVEVACGGDGSGRRDVQPAVLDDREGLEAPPLEAFEDPATSPGLAAAVQAFDRDERKGLRRHRHRGQPTLAGEARRSLENERNREPSPLPDAESFVRALAEDAFRDAAQGGGSPGSGGFPSEAPQRG